MISNKEDLKAFLDQKYWQYNSIDFIENDPISIPHSFSKKEDIEIAAFFAATIAWGNRKSIIQSAQKIIHLLEDSPYEFVKNHQPSDLKTWKGAIHRTFHSDDLQFFVSALQFIYRDHGGLEGIFAFQPKDIHSFQAIEKARKKFLSYEHLMRSEKHFSSPNKGSAAKRINLFLRWMVRKDNIDFGIWKSVLPAQLSCPLDVHSGKYARQLGLLARKQNDWKSVLELDEHLRMLDSTDPVKYDIALFGMGVEAGFHFPIN